MLAVGCILDPVQHSHYLRTGTTLSTATSTKAPRAVFAAMRHPSFRLFTLAGMLWMMADNIEHVISYWVLNEAFHSPTLMGYAVVSHWAPFLLLGVYTGSWADRFDCRKLCIISMVMFMAASVIWGYLFLTDTLQVWHAVIILTLHGLAGSIFMPASQLVIQDIVGNKDLASAVRITATSRTVGILLGPAVGGLLLLAFKPGLGIIVNALIYLPLVVWALREPYTGHTHDEAGTPKPPRMGIGAALRVVKEVSSNRTVLAMMAVAGLSSLLVGNAYQAQMPQFATSFLTSNAKVAYTALLTANAAGAVFGGLLLETLPGFDPNPKKATIIAAGWALCIMVFAVARYYPLALGALFMAGILQIGFTSMATTVVQLEAPVAKRGQVMGVFSMSMNGLRVGSGISVGVLGALVGIRWSLGLSAVILMLVMGALLLLVRNAPMPLAPAGRPSSLEREHVHDLGGGCC